MSVQEQEVVFPLSTLDKPFSDVKVKKDIKDLFFR